MKRDLITVAQAAELLGVSPRRVRAMISQPCPDCERSGKINSGYACPRCHGQGRYLPAMQFGEGSNSPYLIVRKDVELVRCRKAGPRKKN